MLVSLKGFKNLINVGIEPSTSAETSRSIRLVNILSVVTGGTALLLAPLITYLTNKPVFIPGYIEAMAFMCSLYLNYRKQYFWAAVVMLATQNLAAAFFGLQFGAGIPIESLCITLGMASLFIFRDKYTRIASLALSCIAAALVNINDYMQVITPWSFTRTENEMIKWMTDGIIFPLSGIVTVAAVYFIRQIQRASDNKTSYLRESYHEMKRSLTSMTMILEKYNDATSGTKPISQEDYQVMQVATRTMSDMIRDGLNISKIEAGKHNQHELEYIHARTWLEEVKRACSPFCQMKNLAVDMNISSNVPDTFESDRGKLTVILSNLLSNAINFSYKNTVIIVKVTMRNSILTFQVIDYGKGISVDRKAGIFSSLFISEKNGLMEGNGIGMVMTKLYVELLKGEIAVESIEGKGATFTVNIPIKVIDQIPVLVLHKIQPKPEASLSGLLNGKKIVVIDDDEMSRTIVVRFMQKMGCNAVMEAEDEIAGMEMIVKHVPDLVIIDVRLKGKSGLDVVKELRSYPYSLDIPILVLSSENSDIMQSEVQQAGGTLYLPKPFKANEIRNSIIKIFNIRV